MTRLAALCPFPRYWRSSERNREDFTRRAELQVIRIQKRWQRDADYKDTFAKDLIDAETHLVTMPDSGTQWQIQQGRLIRRWLLSKSKCFLYYQHQAERERILVVAIWDCRRGTEPKL